MDKFVLTDRWGNPVKHGELRKEQAAPTTTGIRSPLAGYPANNMHPARLAQILREADQGDPVRYLELAEIIEERDLHYVGVLGTRKRSVSQLDITVEAAGEDPRDVKIADEIRDWIRRDELTDEVFNILDAIGKGYSFTEIIWERPKGMWMPARLEWRDPRWFRFSRTDLSTPLLLDENGTEKPLPPFQFIYTEMKAKSGLALRSGLTRIAAWAWMFKSFTLRDWAIFTQTYGQPLRVGKYGEGASEEDKRTLMRGLSNIAGDCAAMIPQSMMIEFIESKTLGSSIDLFERRVDWLDKQISKAVLGQTGTTDSVTGGLGSSKEHRQVQEDIERSDATQLSAILNRDLIRPWVQLNYGPLDRYPRLRIARPEVEDIEKLASAAKTSTEMGMKISESNLRTRMGFEEPKDKNDVLGQNQDESSNLADQVADEDDPLQRSRKSKRVLAKSKRGSEVSGGDIAETIETHSTGLISGGLSEEEDILDPSLDRLDAETAPEIARMMRDLQNIIEATDDIGEARAMILQAFPKISVDQLSQMIGLAFSATFAGGMQALEDDSE